MPENNNHKVRLKNKMNRPELIFMIDTARGAGEIVRQLYGQDHQVEHKGVIDLVTEADKRSEAYIIDRILTQFPDHGIMAEESGEQRLDNGQRWYIDPLDGTNNYAHDLPIFCVSIAYAENGRVEMGVIYDPMQDECFYAERGKGCFLNGRQLKISKTTDLIESMLVTGFPYNIQSTSNTNLENFAKFAMLTQGVRRLGSAALDIAYVAAGRFDGYWEIGIKPWDIAAGTVMVEEAGGLITDLQGNPDYMKPPYAILTANPELHAKMLQVLNS